MDRVAPTLPDGDDRLRLPPVATPQSGERGEKESQGHHHNQPCRLYARQYSSLSRNLGQHSARTASKSCQSRICQSSARVNGRALGQLVPPPLLADLDALRDPLDRPCRSHGAIRCRLRGRDGVGSFRLALALARIDPGGGHRIAHSSRRGVAQEGMGQLLSLWPWRPGGLHLAMDCDSALRRGFLHLDGPGPPV